MGAILAIHGTAALALAWLPLAAMAVAAVILAGSLAWQIIRAREPVCLRWLHEGTWYDRRRPELGALALAAPTCVSRWLVVLALVDRGGRMHYYPITRAALAAPVRRRLWARLRTEGPSAAHAKRGWKGSPAG